MVSVKLLSVAKSWYCSQNELSVKFQFSLAVGDCCKVRAGDWVGIRSWRSGIMTVEGIESVMALMDGVSIFETGTRRSTVPILKFDHKSKFSFYVCVYEDWVF